jgi:anaerobic selenocysteine-containing dehydrogenase
VPVTTGAPSSPVLKLACPQAARLDKGRGAPPKGSIFVPFFDERLLINDLTLHDFNPISKQPDYKQCAARLKKA